MKNNSISTGKVRALSPLFHLSCLKQFKYKKEHGLRPHRFSPTNKPLMAIFNLLWSKAHAALKTRN